MLRKIVVVVPLALLCAAVFVGTAAAASVSLTRPELALLKAMNRARKAAGLPPLRVSPRLERVARGHTRDMARHGYFSHRRFERRVAGIRARVIGENLAWAPGRRAPAVKIVRMWLSSPPHRANLLRPGFRFVGIAAAPARLRGVGRVNVVTADFAGPR